MTVEIKKLRERRARAEQKLASLKTRESDAKRKYDTRKKIVLGAALLSAAKRDEKMQRLLNYLIGTYLSEKDKRLFENE